MRHKTLDAARAHYASASESVREELAVTGRVVGVTERVFDRALVRYMDQIRLAASRGVPLIEEQDLHMVVLVAIIDDMATALLVRARDTAR